MPSTQQQILLLLPLSTTTKCTNNNTNNVRTKAEIIYRVELPDMEQITLIYLENSDADYRKSSG